MKLPPLSGGTGGNARWALSFADLCLLLLGFLLLLQAHRGDSAALSAGIRAAFGSHAPAPPMDEAAAPMFTPGEAMLLPAARLHFIELGQKAASQGVSIRIESLGSDPGGQRLDAWELAAARAAAIARTIEAGGIDAGKIDVSVLGSGPESADKGPPAADKGQRLRITLAAAAR